MIRNKFIFLLFLLQSGSSLAEFVGIDRSSFEPHYRSQQGEMWCWASSAEMVLSYQGIKLPQEAIVEHVKGYLVDEAGSPMEMINSVNAVLKDIDKKSVVISGQYIIGAPLSTVLYNHLKQKKPVILTYQGGPYFGHAVVLTGIDATVNSNGVFINKLYVFDPFAYRQVMGWQGNRLEFDTNLIYKEYHPFSDFNGIVIEAGVITGVLLVDGTKL